nr:unnamed protein product [Callosobruchus chinensis]
MSTDFVFTIVYFLLCVCLIYPPTEFVSAGLTIPALFSGYLGVEIEDFIKYHIRKSCLYLFIFSLLPLGYVILYFLLESSNDWLLFGSDYKFWRILTTVSLMLPILAFCQIYFWAKNDFADHPIIKNIAKFTTEENDWKALKNDIDVEFRRIDKVSIQTSAIIKIVATDNWLMKVTSLSIFLVNQRDATLTVTEAQTYHMSHLNNSNTQYLNIEVKSGVNGVRPFIIRINASDFSYLKDRVSRATISIRPNVRFHKTIVEQFVDVFKETIAENPIYETNQELDNCIGCLQAEPTIKLQKLCQDIEEDRCTPCNCKPMWCTDCLGKWFASRQDAQQRDQWLSSKCTCPMCRARFCLLDVCVVRQVED